MENEHPCEKSPLNQFNQLNLTTAPVKQVEITALECFVCRERCHQKELFRLNCCEVCHTCAVSQLRSQISEGKRRCCCRQTDLTLLDAAPLIPNLSDSERQQFLGVMSNAYARTTLIHIKCPAEFCAREISALYDDAHAKCECGACICMRHKTIMSRELRLVLGRGDAPNQLQCVALHCQECENGVSALASIMQSIEDTLCEKCPACHNVVGPPTDFSSCLCLYCSYCTRPFCGFCFEYHASDADTHSHVSTCVWNPQRGNMWVTSKVLWEEQMLKRRRSLALALMNNSSLTGVQKIDATARMEILLRR